MKSTLQRLRETQTELEKTKLNALDLAQRLEAADRELVELRRQYSAQNDELDGAKFERTQLINTMERVALMLDTDGK